MFYLDISCVLSWGIVSSSPLFSGGTGVSGLTRGLATIPKVDPGAFGGQR